MTYKVLRLPAVKELTGLSRSTIYQMMAEGAFPRTINLGARSVGWLEQDVLSWIRQRVIASRQPAYLSTAKRA